MKITFSQGVSVGAVCQSHYTSMKTVLKRNSFFAVLFNWPQLFGLVSLHLQCTDSVCFLCACLRLAWRYAQPGSVLAFLFVPSSHSLCCSSLLSLSSSVSTLSRPTPPSIFCYMICRYISPRGSLSVLPSVWGNAAHLWRPQLSAQSLLLLLHFLPNPATHHTPISLHTPGLGVLTSPPLPVTGPAQPHPVSPAQPLSSHALTSTSTTAAQCYFLLRFHTLGCFTILSIRLSPPLASDPLLSPPPESTVIPLSFHLLLHLCRFCLYCCLRFCLLLLSIPVNLLLLFFLLLLVSSICSALLPSTAPSTTSKRFRWCREHVEDSGHTWYLYHLPAPQLPTQIGFGLCGEGRRMERLKGGGQSEGEQRGRMRERLVGSERDRMPVFPVLPQAVVLIEQGKTTGSSSVNG